jgi:hypothetical protein
LIEFGVEEAELIFTVEKCSVEEKSSHLNKLINFKINGLVFNINCFIINKYNGYKGYRTFRARDFRRRSLFP